MREQLGRLATNERGHSKVASRDRRKVVRLLAGANVHSATCIFLDKIAFAEDADQFIHADFRGKICDVLDADFGYFGS